jgi:hypothetical protein
MLSPVVGQRYSSGQGVESVIAVRVAVADLLPDHSLDDCRIVLPGKRFFLAVGHAAFESRVIDQANVCVLVLAGLAVLDAVAQLVVADESTHAVLALPDTEILRAALRQAIHARALELRPQLGANVGELA